MFKSGTLETTSQASQLIGANKRVIGGASVAKVK